MDLRGAALIPVHHETGIGDVRPHCFSCPMQIDLHPGHFHSCPGQKFHLAVSLDGPRSQSTLTERQPIHRSSHHFLRTGSWLRAGVVIAVPSFEGAVLDVHGDPFHSAIMRMYPALSDTGPN